jgi:beta-lactamase class A
MIKNNNSSRLLAITNIITLGAVVFFIVHGWGGSTRDERSHITRDTTGNYKLTSPILDYEELLPDKESIIPVGVIDTKIKDLEEEDNGVPHIALYYRELNNGQWVGLNEKEDFSPASLLKVPVLIAFLKRAEKEPNILEKKVVVSPKDMVADSHQNIRPAESLVPGKQYSLQEIARIMIQDSDNAAAKILIRETGEDYIKAVFASVGLAFEDEVHEPTVRTKDYAGFFRVLYNASYLSRDMSELALEILAGTQYKDGLVAGLPDNITVAHKFGERAISDFAEGLSVLNETQIHDCGIIYIPKKPYILCIMTRGSDLQSQQQVIADLSHFIYEQVIR